MQDIQHNLNGRTCARVGCGIKLRQISKEQARKRLRMRKCWRQHCMWAPHVRLRVVSLRNGKCVKTIQLHETFRCFLHHSAGSQSVWGGGRTGGVNTIPTSQGCNLRGWPATQERQHNQKSDIQPSHKYSQLLNTCELDILMQLNTEKWSQTSINFLVDEHGSAWVLGNGMLWAATLTTSHLSVVFLCIFCTRYRDFLLFVNVCARSVYADTY